MVKEEIKREMRRYFEVMKIKMQQKNNNNTVMECQKELLRGKFVVLKDYNRKDKKVLKQ